MIRLTPLFAVLVLVASVVPSVAVEPTPVTVDLMILYSPATTARYGSGVDTRINHLINAANDAYRRSEAGLRLRVVHSEEVAYSDTAGSDAALDALTQNSGVFSGIEAKRTQVGADLVVLMRPYVGDGICGVAWLGGYGQNGDFSRSRRHGYSHVSIDCSDEVLPHELGHNMGLSHSRRQNGQGGTFPWALGHGVDNSFVTVMAYGSAFGASRVPLFSSPDLVCNGHPCGVDRADPVNGADAVNTLQYGRGQIAAYTAAVVAPPPPPPPPVNPPVATSSVSLTGPVGGGLRQNTAVTLDWQGSSDVVSVDVSYRLETRKRRRWRKSAWAMLSPGDADGTFDWIVPNHRVRRDPKLIRFLLVGYDGSGTQVASEVSSPYRLPKTKKRRRRRRR
ncbi:MAG: hypothetical protein GY937_09885 [bacterium]|nr:hypothetical protein [bacterium]